MLSLISAIYQIIMYSFHVHVISNHIYKSTLFKISQVAYWMQRNLLPLMGPLW